MDSPVEAAGGLIQENGLGTAQDAAGDGQALALASTQSPQGKPARQDPADLMMSMVKRRGHRKECAGRGRWELTRSENKTF